MLGAEGPHLVGVGDEVGGAGDPVDADRFGGLAGADLVPHDLDRLGRGADERDAPFGDGPGEVGVLGEEAVAGVDGVGTTALDGVEDGVGVEVALGCRLTAESERLVGEPGVQGVAVELRVDGHRCHPEFSAGTDDPDGDLAPVGDQDPGKHAIWLPE